jgi:hypothetical protein
MTTNTVQIRDDRLSITRKEPGHWRRKAFCVVYALAVYLRQSFTPTLYEQSMHERECWNEEGIRQRHASEGQGRPNKKEEDKGRAE